MSAVDPGYYPLKLNTTLRLYPKNNYFWMACITITQECGHHEAFGPFLNNEGSTPDHRYCDGINNFPGHVAYPHCR